MRSPLDAPTTRTIPAPAHRRATGRLAAGLVLALVGVAACGGNDGETVTPTIVPGRPSTTVGPAVTDPPDVATTLDPGADSNDTDPGGRGWLGGEPDWLGGAVFESAEDADLMVADAAGGAAAGGTVPSAGEDAAAVPDDEIREPPPDGSPLRAGSVDDNADYEAYLAYLARIAELGITTRDFDPRGRVVVEVVGTDGLPRAGASVSVSGPDGEIVADLTTTADGTTRFMPALHGQAVDGTFTFSTGGAVGESAAGGTVELQVGEPGAHDGAVALDVLFLLDATGSMADEIDRLKRSIDSVAERVSALEGQPDVRFAMTLYRDEGDAFVTATYDFTPDVEEFRAALADVVADGGGDYPEALDEGLAEALAAPAWREPSATVQLVFLVADAPPQVGRQVEVPYPDAVADAIGRGVKVFPVASSESDDQAEAVFRQIAQATGARFVFLSYGAGGAATGGSTDIDRTDYEELALDDLVVRLIAEEVASLTGDGSVVPPPASTTTTTPEGQ